MRPRTDNQRPNIFPNQTSIRQRAFESLSGQLTRRGIGKLTKLRLPDADYAYGHEFTSLGMVKDG
jgi:hypothetical protein